MKNSLTRSIYISLLCLLGSISANAQRPERVLQTGLTNGAETLAFSHDGQVIITSSHGGASSTSGMSIQIWDAKKGDLIRTINAEEMGVASAVAISPDGLMFAAAISDLYVWNSKTGKLLWKRVSTKDVPGGTTISEWERTATKTVAFSPDSKSVFSFTGRFIKVWTADRGTLVSNLTMADSAVFAPSGQYIVTQLKRTISVWDASSLRVIQRFDIGTSGISLDTIAFSRDGKVLASIKEGQVSTWNLRTGKLLRKFDLDNLRGSPFSASDLLNVAGLNTRLKDPKDPLGTYLRSRLTPATRQLLDRYIVPNQWDKALQDALVDNLNTLLKGPSLYQAERFKAVQLSEETKKLIKRQPQGEDPIRLNRMLLEDAYPHEIAKSYRGVFALALLQDGKFLAELDHTGLNIYDAESAQPIKRLNDEQFLFDDMNSRNLVFSPDGGVLAIPGDSIVLFDVMKGNEVESFGSMGGGVVGPSYVDVSPDNKTIAIGVGDAIQLWNADLGLPTASLSSPVKVQPNNGFPSFLRGRRQVIFSPDSHLIAVVFPQQVHSAKTPDVTEVASHLGVFEVGTGEMVWDRGDEGDQSIASLKFSPDGTKIAFSQPNAIQVLESTSGKSIRRIAAAADPWDESCTGSSHKLDFEFSSDGDEIIDYEMRSGELTIHHVDLTTGVSSSQYLKGLMPKELPQETCRNGRSPYIRFSGDGAVLAVRLDPDLDPRHDPANIVPNDNDGVILLVDTSGRRKIQRIRAGGRVADFDLSRSGKSLIAVGRAAFKESAEGQFYNTIGLWDVQTGRLRRSFRSRGSKWMDARSVFFSDDENYVILHEGCEGGCWRGNLRVWEANKEDELAEVEFDPPSDRFRFSLNKDNIVFGDDHRIGIVSLTGNSLVASRGGKNLNGISRRSPLLLEMIFFTDGTWAVIDEHGRFDTNSLEGVSYLRWFISDTPVSVYPLEIFMRDYYEPRLLARILKGEKLPNLPFRSDLTRVQPKIEKITVSPRAGNPELVNVTVLASSTLGKCLKDGKHVPCESGLFDLRLYRDGQLVGQSPWASGGAADSKSQAQSRQDQLQQWRATNVLKRMDGRPITAAAGPQQVVFNGIRLPQRSEVSQVEFTAYAFNVDRVKSATSQPVIYALPQSRPSVRRRAYIVTVGVDATSDPSLRLGFAPNGARDVEKLLKTKLQSHYEIVPVPLISEYKEDSTELAQDLGTKINLQTVLGILSGRDVTPAQRQSLPNQLQLSAATPDDLVVLYIASHGYADPAGKFYVVPSDIGEPAGVSEQLLDRCLKSSEQSASCQSAREFLRRSISSDDLTRWLQTIDAGQMVLILDSCHSAAVSGSGFKPGPMGDRGFGQLSYDKGMLVLAATQAENVDWGTLELGDRSLLTYALTDQHTTGQSFNLRQWLSKAKKQVPTLYRRFVKTEVQFSGSETQQQEPALFDFSKKHSSESHQR